MAENKEMENKPQTSQETNQTAVNDDTKPVIIKSLPGLSERQKSFLATLTSKENYNQSEEGLEKFNVGYNQADLYNNPDMFSDVKIKMANTKDGEILYLHRAVLSHSDYFKQIFLQEKDALANPATTLVLEAPAELQHEYQKVVEFLYSGELTVNKFTLVKYMILADFISCKDLMSACSKYIQKHLLLNHQKAKQELSLPVTKPAYGFMIISGSVYLQATVEISKPVSVVRMYTATEAYAIWNHISEKNTSKALTYWFAAQLCPQIKQQEPNPESATVSGWEIIDDIMTKKLTYDQMVAILECDIQPCNEYEMFNFVLKWLENHTEEYDDALLCKIRYAYMTVEQRHGILTDKNNESVYKWVKNSPTLVQAIIHGSFWHDRLICNTKEFENNVKEVFPEFQKKVYTPRLYGTK